MQGADRGDYGGRKLNESPLILALDTSHMKGSVAVARGEEILCEILFDASDTHSATLMPAVDVCLETAGVRFKDIDLFGVVSGPGSFTGLRIGMATVKAFAAVCRRPVIPMLSLEVLAAAVPFAKSPVLPLIDARRGEVYGGLYRTDDGLPGELAPPFSTGPGKVGEFLADAGIAGPVIVCGTGAARYEKVLSSVVPDGSFFSGPKWSVPSAALVVVLALGKDPVPYAELPAIEPLYIRPPDARLPAGSRLRRGGGE